MKVKPITAAIIGVVFAFSSGCDSRRLDQFASFASAGFQYIQALHKVIDEAGSAMIASDSATLIVARKQAGTGDPNVVRQDDKLLETYLDTLQTIDAHATLLGSYFAALTNLTNGKAATDTASAATGLLDSINSLNPEIEKASFAGKSVKEYVKSATNLVVAHFEVKTLDEQLQKAAPTIDKALSLQEAAVDAIAEQMRASLAASLEIRESTDVIEPYVNGPPPNWNSNRESFLRAKVTIDSVSQAKAAVSHLHVAFKQLVENRHAAIDLATLLNDINKMAGYASAVGSSLGDNRSKQ